MSKDDWVIGQSGFASKPLVGGLSGVADMVEDALNRTAYSGRNGLAPPAQSLRGSRNELWDTITRLRTQAQAEILSIDDTTYLLERGVPESIQRRGPATLRKALDRGVTVRQVTSRTGLLADRDLGAIVHRGGGQARVVSAVPVKLTVLDRKIALLPLDSTVLADGFQVIRDPGAVAALVSVHRALWRAGTNPDDEPDQLPPHLAAVLPGLASGNADDVAARQAGISPRTYSRRVAELMIILGVRNRFQAGVEATRRGWL
jgi:hypothetical protein